MTPTDLLKKSEVAAKHRVCERAITRYTKLRWNPSARREGREYRTDSGADVRGVAGGAGEEGATGVNADVTLAAAVVG